MKKMWILIITIIILGIILIISIRPNNKKVSSMNYEIITDRDIINELKINNDKDRGYEIVQQDNFYYLIIKYGEEPTYYSKLEVTEVKIDGRNLKVYVKLPEDEGMGDAFSYPKAIIKLDQEPEKVDIRYK